MNTTDSTMAIPGTLRALAQLLEDAARDKTGAEWVLDWTPHLHDAADALTIRLPDPPDDEHTADRETGQPYSERARVDAEQARWSTLDSPNEITAAILAAAHDREALGLDASVCARSFLDEIVGLLQADTASCFLDGKTFAGETLQAFKIRLLREFDPNGEQHA